MAPIDPQPASATASAPLERSADWPAFAQRLASILGALREDQCLIVSLKGTNRYMQFAAQGHGGLRAECVSNAYLCGPERLDERQLARLRELGWNDPTGSAPESTPERDPDCCPNHFVEWPAQTAVAGLADLAVTTLVDVLGVAHPGFLECEAFDSHEQPLVFDELGPRRTVRQTTDLGSTTDEELLDFWDDMPQENPYPEFEDELYEGFYESGLKPEDLIPQERAKYLKWIEKNHPSVP